MSIKQHGGIFGRNPTFNTVNGRDIDADGAVIDGLGTVSTQDADSVNIDGGAIDGVTLGTNSAVTEADIDNINIDGNEISVTNTNGGLELSPNGSGLLKQNGDMHIAYQYLGSFPDTEAAVLDTGKRMAKVFMVGTEAGINQSSAEYVCIYNGTTWSITQIYRRGEGNGHGTVNPSMNGNYISMANSNGSSIGFWRIKILYLPYTN